MVVTTEAIWEDLHTGLWQFIRKRVRDEASAEDILQDVFLKVHQRIDSLRERDKVRGWIYQITRNAINDYYRRQPEMGEMPEDIAAPAEEEEDAAAALIPSVRAMIERLPTESRQALLLTEFEGLTQQELAAHLGLSLSGAKSRVQRAREKLKKMLLACCHFELDRAGRIIDYQQHCACCAANSCNSAASPCCSVANRCCG